MRTLRNKAETMGPLQVWLARIPSFCEHQRLDTLVQIIYFIWIVFESALPVPSDICAFWELSSRSGFGQTGHQEKARVGEGERKKRCKTLERRKKAPEKLYLYLSCGCKQNKRNPPNKPRHWRNGLGLLGGVRPIAGTNGSNDCRGEGHNESRTPPPAVHQRVPGTTPSRRRETRNTPVHGRRGAGIHCGRTCRRMLLTYLKREDAREQQQEAGKPRKKHGQEKHREIARRRKNQNQKQKNSH